MSEPAEEVIRILDLKEVIAEERKVYLSERRRLNGLAAMNDDGALWGMGLSGGGIRSATFCLGVLQAFMGRGLMKRFDYLATVSGGGYIGTCLSSLFAGQAGSDTELNLDAGGSPFVGLRATIEGHQDEKKTKLGVRHQMHHLRSHGEYLIPRAGLLSRDWQRFLGAAGLSLCYTLLLFLVAITLLAAVLQFGLTATDPDLSHLAPPGPLQVAAVAGQASAGGAVSRLFSLLGRVAGAWWTQRVVSPLAGMAASAASHPLDLFGMALLGCVWVAIWIFYLRRQAPAIARLDDKVCDEQTAGWTAKEERQSKLNARYNVASLVLVTAVALGVSAARSERANPYLAGFLLPLVFSLSAWVAAFLMMSIGDTWRDMRNKASGAPGVDPRVREPVAQIRRSLYDTVGGANLMGLLAAVAVPFASVLVFSLARLPFKLLLASLLGLAGWWLMRGRRAASTLDTSRLLGPLLDGLVLLLVLLIVSEVSQALLDRYRDLDLVVARGAAGAALAAVAVLLVLGFLFDPNRVSPQHFFSDRLAEAYLRTDARVTKGDRRRHLPLLTLRNDEQLELKELGRPSRAPFQLVVAALNLADSDELVRKRLKSDHFVFSGLHVGSRATGFLPTGHYRAGRTKLATAMAISAAAVASAAGLNTRRSVAFLATLLNARLGVWLENPAHYANGKNPTRPFTFWPFWLLREILGQVKGDTRLVNVSDGGHTGDNLGVMPLLERRCAVVVVCDAEADGDLDFASLRNVVRMANVELNVTIDIDLSPVQRRTLQEEGYLLSSAAVVEGVIHYPEMGADRESTGRLVYIKASVSKAGQAVPVLPAREPLPERVLPASVASYLRGNPKFPHQTTADQFFDDGQFEAYRALGAYLGELAAARLEARS